MMYRNDNKRLQQKLEELYCCNDSCNCVPCNIASNICDCCVNPMRNLLSQLLTILPPAASIQITLTTGVTQTFLVNQVLSLEDNLINIDGLQFIPICNISRIRWRNVSTIDQINLLPLVCTSGDCDCCERPLRERLRRLATNTQLSLQFIGQSVPNNDQQLLVRKIGLGVLIGVNATDGAPDAYSICKLTRVVIDTP